MGIQFKKWSDDKAANYQVPQANDTRVFLLTVFLLTPFVRWYDSIRISQQANFSMNSSDQAKKPRIFSALYNNIPSLSKT